jgi:hypothetical protein
MPAGMTALMAMLAGLLLLSGALASAAPGNVFPVHADVTFAFPDPAP